MREARTVRRVQKFSDLAEPLHQESDSLEAAITFLTQTRDPLLPRLISGKLSVADLDIQFAPSICEETEVSIERNRNYAGKLNRRQHRRRAEGHDIDPIARKAQLSRPT
jgi:hypothetical protein